MKELGPEELGVSSFKEYVEQLLQFPSSKRSSKEGYRYTKIHHMATAILAKNREMVVIHAAIQIHH